MDYKKIYDNIVLKANNENRVKSNIIYYERHHVLPKCLGGLNNKENLILLTAKEHFVCHKLLKEIHINNPKLQYAYLLLCFKAGSKGQCRKYKVSSREYERVKTELSALTTIRMNKKNNPNIGRTMPESQKEKLRKFHTGRKASIETKRKMSEKRKTIIVSEKTKEKLSIKNKGQKRSDKAKLIMKQNQPDRSGVNNSMFGKVGENNPNYGRIKSLSERTKLSESMKGIPKSEDHKQKISESWKNRPIETCIYCGFKSHSKMNIFKWHNENCKNKNIYKVAI